MRRSEAERRLGQLDDVLVYFDERRAGVSPSGPAGPRVAGALDAAAAELGPSPVMMADRGRLRILLASLARTLHVGVLADCFFDPSTALCLKRTTAPEARAPLTALCEPTRCPNLRHRASPSRLGASRRRCQGVAAREAFDAAATRGAGGRSETVTGGPARDREGGQAPELEEARGLR